MMKRFLLGSCSFLGILAAHSPPDAHGGSIDIVPLNHDNLSAGGAPPICSTEIDGGAPPIYYSAEGFGGDPVKHGCKITWPMPEIVRKFLDFANVSNPFPFAAGSAPMLC